ncbi:MAG: ABC transporter ATP-binding protein [Acidobacteria bacterium]|nr:ABC transporter ATP-binding protein [Acidobacteriota bacterium]
MTNSVDPKAVTAAAVAAFGISKRFPGVIANDDVNFEVRVGEVHALLGENGAGKTTLSNILTGLYRPDAGHLEIAGSPVVLDSPREAIEAGIGMVHQHFRLIPTFTVAENIALGAPRVGEGPALRMGVIEERIRELGQRFELDVDPRARIWQLSVGEQQRVEILKVLYRDATTLIMDEPTAVLTPIEAEALTSTIRSLTDQGRSVIFISHKLGEVLSVADRITVLRQGRSVATLDADGATREQLASIMVGREVERVERRGTGALPGAPVVLAVEDLSADGDRGTPALRSVSFEVRGGEIVAVAGVAGNGQRELVEVLAGLRPRTSGVIDVDGELMARADARHPIRMGVAYVPQDRLGTGLAPDLSIAENLVLKRYRRPPVARPPFLRSSVIDAEAETLMAQFDVRAPSSHTPTRRLSGGNVQKVLLAREMSGRPKVLVVSTPTQGLDIGAVATVHRLLLDAAAEGVGVLLVSEDLDEVLALADRILVMYEGTITGAVEAEQASIESIGVLMGGGAAEDVA